MASFKKTAVVGGRPPRKDPLASLKMASMMDTKPVLPAEILARIVDYLAVPDLVRFARVSRRMQEMVYDDTRWVQRLRKMDCWNESEARKRAESFQTDAYNATSSPLKRKSTNATTTINGLDRPPSSPKPLDASPSRPNGAVPGRRKPSLKNASGASDGFDPVSVTPSTRSESIPPSTGGDSGLFVLQHLRSIRGQARQEFGKAYRVLAPYYDDAVSCEDPMSCLIFKSYRSPEHQAQMLAQVRIFARSDLSPGASDGCKRLAEVISVFDTAALLEFRKGYEDGDVGGKMRKYAHVLHRLNGGQSSVEHFIHHNHLILGKDKLGSPKDCIDYASGHGHVSLERSQHFFNRLQTAYTEENGIARRVFPLPDLVMPRFLEEVGQAVLAPYLTSLFDEAHNRGREAYLKTVSGTFAQLRNLLREIPPPRDSSDGHLSPTNSILQAVFGPHLDLYLAEELAFFRQTAEAEVEEWDRALTEQAASTETFLMSNINRQADKNDFLSSFKKVVMMPVNILPSFPALSSNKSTAKALVNGDQIDRARRQSRSSSPTPAANPLSSTPVRSVTPLPIEAPTTELAAKAALMTSKLENIRSLFSIEVALNLVHRAKASLERAALFNQLDSPAGQASKQQCSAIYVSLVQILGTRHVKAGFDKAVDHLSDYNRRLPTDGSIGIDNATTTTTTTSTSSEPPGQGVAPLTTFLELVNVGDLIQQMLDVFFESELIRLGIARRDDFLDPAVKEKKKFEQMLDERVAAGLSKGIDVLMDEVEYIYATTQLPSDFHPETSTNTNGGSQQDFDVGPTPTARQALFLITTHTSMLLSSGSTDKSLLDVFCTEIGLRLFSCLTKHLKRQRISTLGALPLLSDLAAYAAYVASFRNEGLNQYFTALREVGQLYLIEGGEVGGKGVKESSGVGEEMAVIISDAERYKGVFSVEEVVEFAERRADWLVVRRGVERAMFGRGCGIM